MHALRDQLDRVGEPFADFAALGPALVDLAASSWLRDRLCEVLTAHLAAPTRALPEADRERWILDRAPAWQLCVELGPPARWDAFLNGSACHRVIAPLAPLRLQLWRHEVPADPACFDRGLRPRALGERALVPGEFLALEAWRDVAAQVPDPARPAALVLESAPVTTVVWSYSPDGTPSVSAAAEPVYALLDHALRVLLLLGHREGLAACEALLNHPFHGLRWTALRAACGFDPEAGRALLQRALRDPHPHLRAAAARALER